MCAGQLCFIPFEVVYAACLKFDEILPVNEQARERTRERRIAENASGSCVFGCAGLSRRAPCRTTLSTVCQSGAGAYARCTLVCLGGALACVSGGNESTRDWQVIIGVSARWCCGVVHPPTVLQVSQNPAVTVPVRARAWLCQHESHTCPFPEIRNRGIHGGHEKACDYCSQSGSFFSD